jgi:hypothetical protein
MIRKILKTPTTTTTTTGALLRTLTTLESLSPPVSSRAHASSLIGWAASFSCCRVNESFGVHLTHSLTHSLSRSPLESVYLSPLDRTNVLHQVPLTAPTETCVFQSIFATLLTVDEHSVRIYHLIYGWASTLTEVATSRQQVSNPSSQVLLPSWLFHEESDIPSIWHPRLFLPASWCYIYFVCCYSSLTLPLPIHMMQVCGFEVLFSFFLSGRLYLSCLSTFSPHFPRNQQSERVGWGNILRKRSIKCTDAWQDEKGKKTLCLLRRPWFKNLKTFLKAQCASLFLTSLGGLCFRKRDEKSARERQSSTLGSTIVVHS